MIPRGFLSGSNACAMNATSAAGGVIAANGTASLAFAREILRALNVANNAAIEQWHTFHKNGFYSE